MIQVVKITFKQLALVLAGALLLCLVIGTNNTSALTPIPPPDPKPGSYGLEAVKTQPAPTRGATISTPSNGANFTDSPITVSGICPNELLVQVYNNGVMVGSVPCTSGSFSLEVSLFAGTNELTAIVYDDLEQAGPRSNTRTVTYSNTNFTSFGELITLTSSYGRRSAQAGSQLSWPLQLSGGTGPYALSVDWGDGTGSELVSQPSGGQFSIAHVYKQAGIYPVGIMVTDVNGVTAFLQVMAVSSGQVEPASVVEESVDTTVVTKILWVPAAMALVLLLPAYWLGRRSQLITLRNKMLKERDNYKAS